MASRPKVDIPDRVRSGISADLRLARDLSEQAAATFRIRVHLATEQGFTTQQIADELGCSQAAVSKWRIQGEELLCQREGDAPA